MDDEWVLKQVLKNRKRLREVFESDIKEIENGKRIIDLPVDVIALCLSYIDIHDIRNCWNTCKTFANVIKEKKHFWRAITKRQLLTIIGRYSPIIDVFDPFSSIIEEDLEKQFEWFYYPNWLNIYFEENVPCIIQRHSRNGWILECSIIGKCFSSYESPLGTFDEDYGMKYIRYYDDCTLISFFRDSVIKMIFKSTFYNAVWEGEGINVDGYYYAHGEGTWTFDDGTVVNGFADMGEFVYHANFEEWKKLFGKNSLGVNSQNLLPP